MPSPIHDPIDDLSNVKGKLTEELTDDIIGIVNRTFNTRNQCSIYCFGLVDTIVGENSVN